MNGKRNSNWKQIMTGWIAAVLLFGTINVLPKTPLQNPRGADAQITEGQECSEGEPNIQLCGEQEECFHTKN